MSPRILYLAAWIVLLTIYSAALAINGVPTNLAIRNAVANLLPGMLMGIAVLRLPRIVRWPPAHVGLLLTFLALSTIGWIALVATDSFVFSTPFQLNFRIVPFRILNDVLIYCTLAGVAYAWRNAEEVREQAERAAKAEALRARAALEAMRSQLNPHFILNTFHALVGLVRRDPAVAETALERLGDLLRYSLRIQRDGIDEIPLREECAFVESYLALERLRLADRLRVSVQTPPATLECLVPAFAVQILVENSIRHAIAPRAAGGQLHIRAEEIEGRLRLAVKDEGNGASVESRMDGARIGLRLLQERLSALYGEEARLTIRRVEGGTCADLEFPARRAMQEEA